LIEAKDHFDK